MANDLFRIILAHLKHSKYFPIIVSGHVGAGKTRLCQEVAIRLRDKGINVGGVLSPRVVNGESTVGYEIVDLSSKKRKDFAQLSPPGVSAGRFYIDKRSLEWAKGVIRRASGVADVVFVDEVGRLEMRNRGFASVTREVLSTDVQIVLLVRSRFTTELKDKFEIDQYDLVNVR